MLFYKDADLKRRSKCSAAQPDAGQHELGDATQGFIDYWQAKAEKVLGNEYRKKTLKVTDLMERLEGVQNMDMVKPFIRTEVFGDLTIQDLLNGKKLPPEQFRKYQEMVQRSYKALSDLRDEPYYYQVAEGQGNKFFWGPSNTSSTDGDGRGLAGPGPGLSRQGRAGDRCARPAEREGDLR